MKPPMKNNPTLPSVPSEPSETSIREYAFYLYEQSDCAANRDLANWFEATACLKANIPVEESGHWLQLHFNGPDSGHLAAPAMVGAIDS